MTKTTLDTLEAFLSKARKRLSDENPDYSDQDDEQEFAPEEELSEYTKDDADKWLEENDPGTEASQGEEAPEASQDEEVPEEDSGAKPQYSGPRSPNTPVAQPGPVIAAPREKRRIMMNQSEDELQPTREEIAEMRSYTRPWAEHARDRDRLEAQAEVNPIKHHQGRLVEARNLSHKDRQNAYEEFTNSKEYQEADPVTQMEMDAKFHDDWHKQNPEHLLNALNAHHEAHKKGEAAMSRFNQAKDDKIRHIASGGAQPGAYSVEEGMQHAGGSREDEDSRPSGIQQDKSAAFAAGNQEFLRQYMKDYEKRGRRFTPIDSETETPPENRPDPATILGDHPAFKFPDKKRKFDEFTSRYYPLIQKAGKRVINKLGLRDKNIDQGLLDYAGVHALFQAVNDYDHDHPSQAKFVTHLNNKMHGLMQSALKAQDEIPVEMRSAAKQFDQQKRAANASPITQTNKEGVKTTIAPPKRASHEIAAEHPPEVQDRLKRVVAARAPLVRKPADKPPAAAPRPHLPKVDIDDESGDY